MCRKGITTARLVILYCIDLNAFICFTYDCGTVEHFAHNVSIPNMIVVGVPALQNGYVPALFDERGEIPAEELTGRLFIRM
jgi:hypothetical protein